MSLPAALDDLRGRRVARWIRESSGRQLDKYGPTAQRTMQDRAIADFGLLDTGVGEVFRKYSFRLITKVVHKSLSSGLESLFKRLFHETEPPLAKEE